MSCKRLEYKPIVAVSACLAGHAVRYDATDKRHPWVVGELADWAELLAVCPEAEAGLGTPRPPLQLRVEGGMVRLVQRDRPDVDVTAALAAVSARRLADLERVDGYVFKSRSPSCGLREIPIAGAGGDERGQGVFAAAVRARFPELPVIEDGDLDDPSRREAFVRRVIAHARARRT